jgi:histidinol-phosphate phosphatase family protein
MKKIPAIFIDRDGTLIEHIHELVDPSQLKLLPRVAGVVAEFKHRGFLIIGITNQPIVEKGLITPRRLQEIHRALQKMLIAKGAVPLDAIYACPHRYRKKGQCNCRKPRLGLIRRAQLRFPIDMEKSWFIGDHLRDIETGRRAGLKTILVKTGVPNPNDALFPDTKPDYVAKDMKAALKFIK